MIEETPVPGRYRHFKGREYQLLEIARHSETEEILAIYVSVDEPDCIWVRPAAMFSEQIEAGGRRQPRFELTSPPADHLLGRFRARFGGLKHRAGGKSRSQALPR